MRNSASARRTIASRERESLLRRSWRKRLFSIRWALCRKILQKISGMSCSGTRVHNAPKEHFENNSCDEESVVNYLNVGSAVDSLSFYGRDFADVQPSSVGFSHQFPFYIVSF